MVSVSVLQRRFGSSADANIADILQAMGMGGAGLGSRARALLEAAGLTRPGKTRISTVKLADVADTLRSHFVLVCGDERCAGIPPSELERVVSVEPPCSVCGGSEIRRACVSLESRLRSRGLERFRLMVVGGSPAAQAQITELTPRGIEFRFAYGSRGRKAAEVKRDVEWADALLVWVSTEMAHAVSAPYVRESRLHRVLVSTCAKRGVPALLDCARALVGNQLVAA
jgi:hypothetical protein